ncbi:hypothetical protein V502_08801 [Pseudogymnoascus sp. VKM F-4520 (FW-2644)]|nr:hypothetical protein V502_08801 [Pseudogymnoascus sp. VKM F-4520 (FW-2644)]
MEASASMTTRPTVARVRGIATQDVDEAKAIIIEAIEQQRTPQEQCQEQWVPPRIEIIPSCHKQGELEALVDFLVLPERFSSLNTGSRNYTIVSFSSRVLVAMDTVLAHLKNIHERCGRATFSARRFWKLADYGEQLQRAIKVVRRHCLLEDRTLLEMTKAIMFFAVPHRGMDLEDMVSSLGETPEGPTAIHEINDWEKILGEFIKIVGHIKYLGSLNDLARPTVALVPAESAKLGLPKDIEVTFPVAQDHSSIVKFNNCYDETFRFVESRLEEVVLDVQTPLSQHEPQPLTIGNEERLAQDIQGSTGNFGPVVARQLLTHPQYSQESSKSMDAASQDEEHERRLIKALPELGKLFGRQELLDELDNVLSLNGKRPYEKHIYALYGLTGGGKTHIALEWVKRQLSTKPHRKIYWMKGHSQEVFEHSVGLMFPHNDSLYEDNDKVIGAGLRYNLEWRPSEDQGVSPTYTIQEVINNITQGVIIVTTNQYNLAKDAYDNHRVDALDPDASFKYLKASVSHYVPKEEDLEIRNKLAVNVLKLYGFLEHSNFSSWLLLSPKAKKGYYWNLYPEWFSDITDDTWNSLKEDLSNLFFVEVVGDRRGIPPSVHQFARDQAGDERSDYILLAISLVAASVPQSDEAGSWETSKQLLPHAEQCWKYLPEAKTIRQEDLAQFGNLFRQAGRYSEAIEMYGTVLASLSDSQSVRDEDKEFRASMLNNIGLAFLGNRDYARATMSFQKSREWRRSIHGVEDSYNALYNTGLVEKALGRLESAEQMFLNAQYLLDLEDDRQRLGQIELEKTKILNNLGEEQLERAELEQVLPDGTYLKALASEASYPKVIFARLNLAKVSIRQGMLPSAMDELDEISKSCTKAWGENHPQSMGIYTEVAIWYLEYGQRKNQVKSRSGDGALEAAASLCIQIKEFYQGRYGDYSDLTLRIELLLGIVQSAMDHSREAERIIRRVIQGHLTRGIKIRHSSDSDTEWMLDAHVHLALVLADQGRYQEATKALTYMIDRYDTPPLLFRQRLQYNKAIFFKAMVLLEDGHIEEASRILYELSTTEGVGRRVQRMAAVGK